jgi:signal transduction histidine kinase
MEIPFKISSALKNIIGKELITDEFVAVFELVKNSFDANATNVEIIFENEKNLEKGKITIRDNGKGMNENDLKNKWLFVAYSAKKDGTENNDYRNRIKINRIFAGAKGVGRFSCDRLGRFLLLTSVKDEKNATTQIVKVNWEDFEEDPKKEFINVNVDYQVSKKVSQIGTQLEITGLRDVWDRERMLKLKKSLAKLINPNQENDSNNFQIQVVAKSELSADKNALIEYDRINGFIKNDVFESLKIKTTSIKVEISTDGKTIISTLQDRGDRIYTLKEKNTDFNNLENIQFHLFQLNRSAKTAFTKSMRIEPIKYGSVFMYKNGFRVYPFGEVGEDLLLIDRRKTQGYNRFLGNRDIIGRIEIYGEQPELRETTSRDGGLVKTTTYNELVDFFHNYVLKRLENYVVNVIKWGDEKINEETGEIIHPELWAKDVKIQILELITGFIKSENILSIDYDKNFLAIIESKQDKSVDRIIKNISKIGVKSNNPTIVKEAAKIEKVVKDLKAETKIAEIKAANAEDNNVIISKELEQKIQQLRIVTSISSQDLESITNLHHQVLVISENIKDNLLIISRRLEKGEVISNLDLKEFLNIVSFDNSKIESISKFGTRAIFEDFTTISKNDINNFIENYIQKISKYFNSSRKIKVEFHSKLKEPFNIKFRPLDISIIIDNMISNAKKANATVLSIVTNQINDKSIQLIFKDNGDGLNKNIKDVKEVFEKGFSTTKSTGLGLFHINNLIKDYKWQIDINKAPIGLEFILTLR